ncbi:MAG TPA: alkaline phosphatase [Syntrophales bacterium]|nr:alkaline phosphatase [Syntrophales bacterium]HPQ45365.1 alkaline phosphatase [Syntrophales bacterium]
MKGKKVFNKRLIRLVVLALSSAVILAATSTATCAQSQLYTGMPAKYVFYFIGDGLGQPQRTAAEEYYAAKTGMKPGSQSLKMGDFPAQGLTSTHANNRFITGSAAAATALACGYKTNIDYIAVDPQFRPLKTIAEMAKDRGMKVGIISSVSIDHATPACFYAHQPNRSLYHEIEHDLAGSGFDYFAGGGFKDPTGKKSKKPLGDVFAAAKKNGYSIVTDRKAFMALTPAIGKVIAYNSTLPDGKALPYQLDNTHNDITLAEFTSKGIELLDNRKGFFMMVEGGKIDWACHANDAVSAIMDTLAFDDAIGEALDFYSMHPKETIIVVTGDHECGGLALGFAGTKYDTSFDVLKKQSLSFQKFTDEFMAEYKKTHTSNADFNDILPEIERSFGLTAGGNGSFALANYELGELEKAFEQSMSRVEIKSPVDYVLYGGYDPLTVKITHILNRKAGLAWTSYSHTGVPVITSAKGVGEDIFNGYYDNTDVARKLMSIMGIKVEAENTVTDQSQKIAMAQ